MPFDLRNEVQTFQRFINKVLHGLDFCYAYMDILIASSTKEEHLKPEGIIPCIQHTIKSDKCIFGAVQVIPEILSVRRRDVHYRRKFKP